MKKRLLQTFFLCLPLALLLTVAAWADGAPLYIQYLDNDGVDAMPGASGYGWAFQGSKPAILTLNNFNGKYIGFQFDVPIYGNMEINLTNGSVNTIQQLASYLGGELTVRGNGMLLIKSDANDPAVSIEGSLKIEAPLRMIGGTSESDRKPLTIRDGKAVTSDGQTATYVAILPSGSEDDIPAFPSDETGTSARAEFPDTPSEVSYTVLYRVERSEEDKSPFGYTEKMTASGNTVRFHDYNDRTFRLVEYTGSEIREISERYGTINTFTESGYVLVGGSYRDSNNQERTGNGVMDKSGQFVVDIGKYELENITDDGYVIANDHFLLNLKDGSLSELPQRGENREVIEYGGYNNGLIPSFEGRYSNNISHSWKYMDSSGNVIFDTQIENAISAGGKSGFLDMNAAGDFHHGYAVIHKRVNGRRVCSIIDTTGKEIFSDTSRKYQEIFDVSAEGLALAKAADDVYDYIDVHGNLIIPGGYSDAEMFCNGCAVVERRYNQEHPSQKSGCALIDTQGHIIIPFGLYNVLTNVSDTGLVWAEKFEYDTNTSTAHYYIEVLKVAVPPTQFSDVPEGAYYVDAVNWAVDNGVTNGVSATNFAPADICNRGQVATFLWRANGSPEPVTTENPFTDVDPSSAFYKAILWAAENGITAGTSESTFSPGNPCTRAHVVTFLWRAQGRPAPSGEGSLADSFPQGYYTDAVRWADAAGLLNGTGEAFTPSALCPRADIVTYLYRNLA